MVNIIIAIKKRCPELFFVYVNLKKNNTIERRNQWFLIFPKHDLGSLSLFSGANGGGNVRVHALIFALAFSVQIFYKCVLNNVCLCVFVCFEICIAVAMADVSSVVSRWCDLKQWKWFFCVLCSVWLQLNATFISICWVLLKEKSKQHFNCHLLGSFE